MKQYLSLAAIVLFAVSLIGCNLTPRKFEPKARQATGAIIVDGKFHCSGTEIGHTQDGDGIFLTARHCVADLDTNEVTENFMLSFSDNEGGPYYQAAPIAISSTDDLALLIVRNGAGIPEVAVRDERVMRDGDPLFNISFPLGGGKLEFHGQYMAPRFPHMAIGLEDYKVWANSMPVNCTWAHGSSGSGIFSEKQRGLIGVVVGATEEGSYNIAIPGDVVLNFLHDLKDNTVDKFEQANPVKEASDSWF